MFRGAGAEAGRQRRRMCGCGRARPARRSVGNPPSTSGIRAGGASRKKPMLLARRRGCPAQVCSGCMPCNLHSPRSPSARCSLARIHQSAQQAVDAGEPCAGRAWDGYGNEDWKWNEDCKGAGPDLWRLGPLCFGPLAARQQRRQTRNGLAHTLTLRCAKV